MSIHSHLQYDQSTSHARVPAGGIHLIASIDSVSEAQVTASFFGSTKSLHGKVATPSDETTTHNHSNQQYSITAITTSTGNIAERYAYSAFGEPTICDASGSPLATQVSTLGNRYSYTGREWDGTVGLHHFRARWMSPKSGRFLTRDPIGFKGGAFNISEYCHGSSFNFMDPSGQQIRPNPSVPWAPYPYPTSPLPPTPPSAPLPPRNPFNGLGMQLAAMCSTCCRQESCECASDSFDVEQALNNAWNINYGNGPHSVSNMSPVVYFGYCINQLCGERDDTIGGYYCYDWSSMLNSSLPGSNRSSCFSSSRKEVTHNTETDANGNPLIHAYVEITIGNGGPGCTLNVDDGWGNGSYVNIGVPVSNPGNWSPPHPPTM